MPNSLSKQLPVLITSYPIDRNISWRPVEICSTLRWNATLSSPGTMTTIMTYSG